MYVIYVYTPSRKLGRIMLHGPGLGTEGSKHRQEQGRASDDEWETSVFFATRGEVNDVKHVVRS
jgi:hypothetical protein